MSEALSLSIFAVEADRKPLLAFAARKHEDAEAFCADERVLTKLRAAKTGGVPLCDVKSIMRIRLATSEEKARYRDRAKQRTSMENRAAFFWSMWMKHRPARRASDVRDPIMLEKRVTRWTPNEDDLFRRMAEANIRPELIAAKLNRSVHAIKARAYTIGLPLKWFKRRAMAK